ncbi:hypothetical protein [Pseudomonas aegrilactucae]|uniref:Uncharacterized protein n=1 Tax=Pseudomonas aegrilactucae TaxID=2854028 RepID=A0A9Q3ABT6_9PSED|nr:hypothetical protein [Pseudomonas aegrilactucae]MBV6285513.1 hypothetical protein [Pseudomonas aegrilactucae]
MYVKAHRLTAQNDQMPGNVRFRVHGTVTVATSAIVPVLVKREHQDKSHALALELKLENVDALAAQVITERAVSFEMAGDHSNIPKVDIFHDGKLLVSLDEIVLTH